MKTVAVAFFILLSCQIGHGLECYECNYGCLSTSTTTCSSLQACATYRKGGITLSKGCLDRTACIADIVIVTYGRITLKNTRSCCYTNLCNSAVVPRVSAITGIAVLVTLWLAKLF